MKSCRVQFVVRNRDTKDKTLQINSVECKISDTRRITEVFGRILQNTATGSVAVFFLFVQTASECALCDTRVGKSWANNPWAFLPTIEDMDFQHTVYQHSTEVTSLKSGVLNKILLKFKVKIV